jgi:hypothetical protein
MLHVEGQSDEGTSGWAGWSHGIRRICHAAYGGLWLLVARKIKSKIAKYNDKLDDADLLAGQKIVHFSNKGPSTKKKLMRRSKVAPQSRPKGI